MLALHDHKVGKEFAQMYQDLLTAVSENDSKEIDRLCEKSLAKEWKDGLNWIKQEEIKGLELLNEDAIEEYGDIKIEVVDYYSTFGAYIDRETNKELGVVPNPSNFTRKRPNLRLYGPENPKLGDDGWPSYLPMNL